MYWLLHVECVACLLCLCVALILSCGLQSVIAAMRVKPRVTTPSPCIALCSVTAAVKNMRSTAIIAHSTAIVDHSTLCKLLCTCRVINGVILSGPAAARQTTATHSTVWCGMSGYYSYSCTFHAASPSVTQSQWYNGLAPLLNMSLHAPLLRDHYTMHALDRFCAWPA